MGDALPAKPKPLIGTPTVGGIIEGAPLLAPIAGRPPLPEDPTSEPPPARAPGLPPVPLESSGVLRQSPHAPAATSPTATPPRNSLRARFNDRLRLCDTPAVYSLGDALTIEHWLAVVRCRPKG